jgi:anaerobic selenocysteine-containing dehydrogenase
VAEIRRIQSSYGRDAFGVLGGASMTTEKTYLMGKFARVALRTRHIDYNGRLCMVSAAPANKKAFGIDRAGNPWADLLETEMIMVAGHQHRRVLPGGHAVLLGGQGPRGQAGRWSTRARRPWPAPPTSTWRCGPAPTPPSTTACCT